MNSFFIGDRQVGQDHKPLVIAEIGINHGGSLTVAKQMAHAAINAGAEIIKHQTHIVEDEMSSEARDIIPDNADKSIFDVMDECALSESEEKELKQYVEKMGCLFISTPFSREAALRLQRFDVPAYKIGSGECNNYPLVKLISSFGKPVILSSGMNDIESIKTSVDILRAADVPFALLHCTNVYPTPPNLVRLGALEQLKNAFPDAVIGLSDHTISNHACFGAVALGASVLERHFTDSMEREGPDIVCSMDPEALQELIQGANMLFEARGGEKGIVSEEISTSSFAFSSIVAIRALPNGHKITEQDIWPRRPAGGDFSAQDFESLLGRVVVKPIAAGARLKKSDLAD